MSVRLGIDVGNSLSKFFRLPVSSPPKNGSELKAWIEGAPSGELDFLEYDTLLSGAHVDMVSVNPQRAKLFLPSANTSPASFFCWTAKTLPLNNPYGNPDHLGPDRPLAAWAAHRVAACPVVVIDSGTALTVDVINRAGDFLGGAIAPGLRTIQEALGTAGAMLHKVEETGATYPGTSTEDCLSLGAFSMFAGGVKELLFSALKVEPQAQVFVTGGDRELVGEILGDFQPQLYPLIHLGLALLSWQREEAND